MKKLFIVCLWIGLLATSVSADPNEAVYEIEKNSKNEFVFKHIHPEALEQIQALFPLKVLLHIALEEGYSPHYVQENINPETAIFLYRIFDIDGEMVASLAIKQNIDRNKPLPDIDFNSKPLLDEPNSVPLTIP
ncbi:hypothetical protein [Spirochaeta lutea]|uniref:Uncharacterized protein n=1 Tax=Spirochaeta lutea TaxID=1480694 RepID=A0A098QT07_9SPIO|nr:hypothetical protein [Spirochaeta lutea]KGE71010.1 hypothetical protein DC28_13895 [Spirochaeta lutea]